MTREVVNTNTSAARRTPRAAAAPEPPRRHAARPVRRAPPLSVEARDPVKTHHNKSAATMLSPKIIALEEGWNNEIKAKAIDVLARA